MKQCAVVAEKSSSQVKMGDNEPTTLAEYRALTAQQKKLVRKPALQALLEGAVNNETDDGETTLAKLDEILDEVRGIKDKFQKANEEIERLDKIVKDQTKILSAQQKFLEDNDFEKRGNDLIVLGAAEENDDNDCFNRIIDAIEVQRAEIRVRNIMRLVAIGEGNNVRKRPIKITLESRKMRDTILKNAKKLKDLRAEDPLRKIFLKPDVHPEIRKEEKRLYDIFKSEKDKACNADLPVVFDRKKRVVTVNGEEIDKFRLFSSHFQ